MSLLPDLNTNLVLGYSVESVPDSVVDANEPRVVGTGTVTVAGSVVNGDVLSLTLTSALFSGGTHAVTATAATSDTDSICAEKLANSINNDATLQSFGAYATALAAVLTIHWPGPLGSFVTFALTSTGSEGGTDVQITGGSGPVIATADTRFGLGNQIVSVRKNRRYSFDAYNLAAIVAGGTPAIK